MATTNPKIDYDGFDHSKDALMTKEVVCTSTADGSQQAFRVFLAPGSAPRPLLVMLMWPQECEANCQPLALIASASKYLSSPPLGTIRLLLTGAE